MADRKKAVAKKRLDARPDFASWPTPASRIEEVTCGDSHTRFRLWSPQARAVTVRIYEDGAGPNRTLDDNGRPLHIDLMPNGRGSWCGGIARNLKGRFYTFEVTDAKGRKLGETPGLFAKAVGVNGQRAQVLDLTRTNPPGWTDDRRPPFTTTDEAIVYELHLRDFSMDAMSGLAHKGKFLSLAQHGTTNDQGERTGIDHLVELGVTHVHLLPVFDFGSVDESRPDLPQYNWGYDPMNYNVPEGSYSTDAHSPEVRIREFKEMVMALHRAGLRVVMDVVYNHVYDLRKSNFERTAPGYFFRWNADGTPSNGSGCGNETASERTMMRRFMTESVAFWATEYHIDGFRFDLMGLHDVDTMNVIRNTLDAIDPSILVYGEGWTAATPQLAEQRLASKAHIGQMPGIAAFGDEMRDALRGPWDNDRKGAFLVGKAGHEAGIRFGLEGASSPAPFGPWAWAKEPTQMMAYVSCHDDLCLADRLKATRPRADEEELKRLQMLALTAVLTSRGIPFIWCGDEMMRNRKGVRNCYRSPDAVNAIPWSLKTTHKDVFLYIRGLIQWRRRTHFQRGRLDFLPTRSGLVVAYRFACPNGDTYIVILNSNRRTISQPIPSGEWTIIAQAGVFNLDGMGYFSGRSIKVAKQSALIMRANNRPVNSDNSR